MQELLSGPQLVHDNELAESDGDDGDDDEMDVDMEPSSSKGNTEFALYSSMHCAITMTVAFLFSVSRISLLFSESCF